MKRCEHFCPHLVCCYRVVRVVAIRLFVVVALALDDSTGAIQLLGEYQSHHLMRECHSRERNLLVGALVHGVGEAIRSADDENKSTGSLLLFLKPCAHLHACALCSVLVEQNNRVGRLYESQYLFAFSLLLLILAEVLRVLQGRDGGYAERHVVGDALRVVLDAVDVEFVVGLADKYQLSLHTPPFSWGS